MSHLPYINDLADIDSGNAVEWAWQECDELAEDMGISLELRQQYLAAIRPTLETAMIQVGVEAMQQYGGNVENIEASQQLNAIRSRLEGTAWGEGLRRALGLADDSLATAARRAGCTRQGILKAERLAAKKLRVSTHRLTAPLE